MALRINLIRGIELAAALATSFTVAARIDSAPSSDTSWWLVFLPFWIGAFLVAAVYFVVLVQGHTPSNPGPLAYAVLLLALEIVFVSLLCYRLDNGPGAITTVSVLSPLYSLCSIKAAFFLLHKDSSNDD
jgi:hypothetical protein